MKVEAINLIRLNRDDGFGSGLCVKLVGGPMRRTPCSERSITEA